MRKFFSWLKRHIVGVIVGSIAGGIVGAIVGGIVGLIFFGVGGSIAVALVLFEIGSIIGGLIGVRIRHLSQRRGTRPSLVEKGQPE